MIDDNTAKDPRGLSVVKGDIEKAKEYKQQVADLAKPICDVLTKAKKEGIIIAYSVQADAMGNYFLAQLTATKEL